MADAVSAIACSGAWTTHGTNLNIHRLPCPQGTAGRFVWIDQGSGNYTVHEIRIQVLGLEFKRKLNIHVVGTYVDMVARMQLY